MPFLCKVLNYSIVRIHPLYANSMINNSQTFDINKGVSALIIFAYDKENKYYITDFPISNIIIITI
jgi:hypothetical protein